MQGIWYIPKFLPAIIFESYLNHDWFIDTIREIGEAFHFTPSLEDYPVLYFQKWKTQAIETLKLRNQQTQQLHKILASRS